MRSYIIENYCITAEAAAARRLFCFHFLSVVASLLRGHNSAGRKKVNLLRISFYQQEEPSAPQNFLEPPAADFPISRRKVKTHLQTPICGGYKVLAYIVHWA